jgi:hypothetical protein
MIMAFCAEPTVFDRAQECTAEIGAFPTALLVVAKYLDDGVEVDLLKFQTAVEENFRLSPACTSPKTCAFRRTRCTTQYRFEPSGTRTYRAG